MKRFRFHILGLPHVPSRPEISCCAYSQKALRLSRLLTELGHTVFYYGVEGSEVQCSEFIQVLSEADRAAVYGNYDWGKEFFKFDGKDAAYKQFNKTAGSEIQQRAAKGDFLLCTFGNLQQSVAQENPTVIAVEPGVGYTGTFSNFRVWESYAWMHYNYGRQGITNGLSYDAVIPNCYDPAEFIFSSKKDNYFLYMGRVIYGKGVYVAAEVCRQIGAKLIVAGQGDLLAAGVDPSLAEHVGSVGPKVRAEYLAGAKALFVPTYYIGPFEGVSIEAGFAGTPVITSDTGAFSENVLHGITGYRCHNLDQFIWAAKNIDQIDPRNCRQWAGQNFSLDRAKVMYQEYFEMVSDVFGGGHGWHEIHKDRTQLNWLERRYP